MKEQNEETVGTIDIVMRLRENSKNARKNAYNKAKREAQKRGIPRWSDLPERERRAIETDLAIGIPIQRIAQSGPLVWWETFSPRRKTLQWKGRYRRLSLVKRMFYSLAAGGR